MADPFADLIPSNAPTVIRGRPKTVAPVNPLDERGKILDNELKEQRLAKGDPDAPGAAEAKATEAAAAGFYARALNAHKLYGAGLEPRGSGTQMVVDMLPRGVVNDWSSPERREAQNLADEFIRAKLRKESGAVIGEEEMRREYETYFPFSGDTQADMVRKARLREQALEGLRVQAGPAADAPKLIGGEPDATKPKAADIKFGAQDGPAGFRMTPEQTTMWNGYLTRNKGKLSPDAMGAAYEAITGQGLNPEQSQEVIDYLAKGGDPSKIGVDYSKTDAAAEAAARQELTRQDASGAEEGPIETLLTSGLTLNLSDEAAGVGRGLSKLATGGNPIEGYRLGRDAERLRIADARKQLGYGGTALEVAGGFLSANPGGAIRAATGGLRSLVAEGAKQGAGVGALAGFGSGEGFGDSAEKAVLGGALGAAIGGGVSGLSARAASRAVDPELGGVLRASSDENVSLFRPMIDDGQRAKFGVREAQSGSGPVIREGVQRTLGEIEGGVTRLGRGGTALDEQGVGSLVQNAATRDHTALKATRTRLYTRAEQGALAEGNPDIAPAQAITQLDEHIADLSRLPEQNAGEIVMLEGLKRDLSQPGLKLQDIRDMRTGLRKRITGDLLGTSAERRAGMVLDAARDDIAGAVSPKTAKAYADADRFEAQRREYVTNTLQKFIGTDKKPVSPGQAFQRLKAMASPRGDGPRLARFYRSLDQTEQGDVAASFAQMAAGENFTVGGFLSNIKSLSPSARRTVFGPSGAKSIENLELLSRRLIAGRSEQNFTKSGKTASGAFADGLQQLLIGGAGLGAGIGSQSVVTGVGAGVAALAATTVPAAFRSLGARVMMSPRFTRWYAEAALAKSPTAARDAVRRLSNVAAREPAIAGEIGQLQKMLESQFRPAMASEEASSKDQRDQ